MAQFDLRIHCSRDSVVALRLECDAILSGHFNAHIDETRIAPLSALFLHSSSPLLTCFSVTIYCCLLRVGEDVHCLSPVCVTRC